MPKHVNPCYACPCVTVGVWQDLLVSILASCSGVMVVLGGCWGISINLWATMGNHGRHVTWSWKWTLMVIFWYVCVALVAALIFKLRGLTSMLPHTSSKTAAFAWRQCRGLLNMLIPYACSIVFVALVFGGDILNHLRSWRVLEVLPVAQRPGRRDSHSLRLL